MPTLQFCLSIAILLLTPGPTNTLMALAGAERGWAGAFRLAPIELAAYGLVTIPLAIAGESLFAAHGTLRLAVTFVAAAWVAFLAVKLWRPTAGDAMAPNGKGALKLFTTTLLNPKGLVIGLVLLPSQQNLAGAVLAFFAILLAVSAVWAGIGSTMTGGHVASAPVLRRACACWLAVLSLWLVARGLAA